MSDHTSTIYTSLGAIALGATVIEKHFTLNKKSKGPDHASSIEPSELKNLTEGALQYLKLGNQKKFTKRETNYKMGKRKCCFYKRNKCR